jgi:protein-S-isoprenylcysteine O-methyltransferase Ste14
MISNTLLLLLLCNFGAIGLLPLVFFRKDGTYNLRWLVTAAPFFLMPVLLVLGRAGILNSFLAFDLGLLAVLLSVLSIALIAMTVATHRIPLALWHQNNDKPVHLVTWGPYSCIRHPFYTGFLLAFSAATFALPHPLTVFLTAFGAAALTVTAIREEQRLKRSEFGDQYAEYMAHSGRFLPRFSS